MLSAVFMPIAFLAGLAGLPSPSTEKIDEALPCASWMVAEETHVVVTADCVELEGRCRLRDVGGTGERRVRYPLPHADAELVGAWIRSQGGDEQPLTVILDGSGFLFDLPPGGQGDRVRLRYRIRRDKNAERIVLRDRETWGRELEEAEFLIYVAEDLDEPSLSYPFRYRGRTNAHSVYYYRAAPFLPDNDLVISWPAGH